MKPYLYCLMVAMLSLPLSAEIYKYKDERGRTVYSDNPPPKYQQHEKLEFEPLNSHPPVEPQSQVEPTAPSVEDNTEYNLTFTTPADGAQIPPGQRDLQLAVRLNPPLRQGHAIQFTMNGVPQGEPTRNNSWLIEEIYRGTHTLGVRLINAQGSVLASDTVTVHVHRPTVNAPAF